MVNILLPDDTVDVESVFKLIPKVLVEMIGSSKRSGYEECIFIYWNKLYISKYRYVVVKKIILII